MNDLLESHLEEVAPGVHAWQQSDGTWWINNAGAIELGDEVLLVDTCATEARTCALLSAVADATSARPIGLAVNTHHHGDHTFGNSLLPASARIVGHRRMREALAADTTLEAFPPYWAPRPHFGSLTRRLPDLVIDGDLVIEGSRTVELRHPGYAAHTAGDLVVWLPDARVLFAGDLLFPGHTPMVLAGALTGARRALDWIAGFEPELVVPGHGPLLNRAALAETLEVHRAYYDFVLAEARRGLADGQTPLETAGRAELGPFAQLHDPERLVLNLHAARAELGGPPVDRAAALADAVTWNGGPMHTSA